jgi:hypothetical protein
VKVEVRDHQDGTYVHLIMRPNRSGNWVLGLEVAVELLYKLAEALGYEVAKKEGNDYVGD